MSSGLEARLRALEDDLEKRLTALEEGAVRREVQQARREKLQEDRHEENSKRLGSIEETLIETAVYFKIGRWVMVAIWSVASAVITALSMKWLGAK